jgi:acyl carrier protein
MTRDDIFEGVRSVLREKLCVEQAVELGTEIAADLQLDSVQQLTLVVELENRFEICFEPGDEHGIVTLADVVTLVESCLDGQPAAANPGGTTDGG